jgi:predicted nucleic acid-binding protein
MIAVVDTNELLRMAAARQESPLFVAWRNGSFELALSDKIVTPAIEFPHCRDPKDDIVIATAVAAYADFIMTSDGDLHAATLAVSLREPCNIRVVYPAEFLEALHLEGEKR